MDFQYKQAWADLAGPEFERLTAAEPGEVSTIGSMLRAIVEARGCFQQDQSCAVVVIPGDTETTARALVENIDQHVAADPLRMAQAARAIYFHGHWFPGTPSHYRSGEHWIFSHLVDQALLRHLGLPPRSSNYTAKGFSITVHEGMLRLCLSSDEGWTWEEIGWATPENLVALRKFSHGSPPSKYSRRDKRDAFYERTHERLEKAKKTIGLADPTSAAWLLTTETYSGDPKVLLIRKLNADAPEGFAVKDRQQVNFRPHPFTIGPKHLERSFGILNPKSAPCANNGCKLSYEEHTHDTVMVITAPGEAGKPIPQPEGLGRWLTACAAQAALVKLPIDGFTFVGE